MLGKTSSWWCAPWQQRPPQSRPNSSDKTSENRLREPSEPTDLVSIGCARTWRCRCPRAERPTRPPTVEPDHYALPILSSEGGLRQARFSHCVAVLAARSLAQLSCNLFFSLHRVPSCQARARLPSAPPCLAPTSAGRGAVPAPRSARLAVVNWELVRSFRMQTFSSTNITTRKREGFN